MHHYYILNEDHTTSEATFDDWTKWIERWGYNTDKRRVAISGNDDVWVSTVFIGMNLAFDDDAPPLVFETMVFGLKEEHLRRCTTWDEAVIQHREVCEEVGVPV